MSAECGRGARRTDRAWRRTARSLLLFSLCAACARNGEAPARNAEPVSLATGFGDGFELVEARGQGLRLLLPDAAAWTADPSERHSWVARHAPSASLLVARIWHLGGVARHQSCEEQARAWRPDLPALEPGEVVATSTPTLAGIYSSSLIVGVQSQPEASPASSLRGSAVAIGYAARSCLLLAFTTSARGPAARQQIADRLAVVVPSVFLRAEEVHAGGVPRPGSP